MSARDADMRRVLLIHDPALFELQRVDRLLAASRDPIFLVFGLAPVELSRERLAQEPWDAFLLATGSDREADRERLDLLRRLFPGVPVVVLGEGDGREWLRGGAQDFLMRGELETGALARAIEHAVQRQEAQAPAAEQESAMGAVLDHIPLGVVLLNVRGRVLFRNHCAADILERSGCLFVDRDQHLRSACRGQPVRLEDALASVLGHDGGDDPSCALSLGGGAMRGSVDVVITSVGSNRPGAVVFLSEPERPLSIALETLCDLYGLSLAEARVVAGLARGRRAEDVAADLGVSLNTVRTQIKQAFRKSGTSRQSELIKLILTGPAVVAGRQRERAAAAASA